MARTMRLANEPEFKPTDMLPCEVCEYAFAECHRIKPGEWGGEYIPENTVWLCPNHHRAIHVLTKWYGRKVRIRHESEAIHYDLALSDRCLMVFFRTCVRPIVIERLKAEGKWFPFVRTLPPKEARKTEAEGNG